MPGYLARAAAMVVCRGLILTGLAAAPAPATAGQQPRLVTNEAYIEEVSATTVLAIDDPMAVFIYVLGQLPERVKVYPTENYYYFSFVHGHLRYAGSIRLDAADRDRGWLHFAYYLDVAEWRDEEPIRKLALDANRGVTVERIGPFAYRVAHDGKSVTFELNDLSQVKPPTGTLAAHETFVGPIFDESGIRFFLVYNRALKLFLYILDETVATPDVLARISATDRILIGKRTGFAFYRDHRLDRKILIGVYEENVSANNFFDGPFDQMPDNFIEGDTLLEAILAVQPSLQGNVDRFGNMPPGDNRYLIAPYVHYSSSDDLMSAHACATNPRIPYAFYYECFLWSDEDDEERQRPSPLRERERGKSHRVPHFAPVNAQ